MRHYDEGGMAVATMVHHVITIYEGVCCVLCVCCTEDYFHMANTVHGQYLCVVPHRLSGEKKLGNKG